MKFRWAQHFNRITMRATHAISYDIFENSYNQVLNLKSMFALLENFWGVSQANIATYITQSRFVCFRFAGACFEFVFCEEKWENNDDAKKRSYFTVLCAESITRYIVAQCVLFLLNSCMKFIANISYICVVSIGHGVYMLPPCFGFSSEKLFALHLFDSTSKKNISNNFLSVTVQLVLLRITFEQHRRQCFDYFLIHARDTLYAIAKLPALSMLRHSDGCKTVRVKIN